MRRVLEVKIRAPSYLKYGCIPTRKEDEAPDFFPDLGNPFQIMTEFGVIWCHCTSERQYNNRFRPAGNYIYSIGGSGLTIKQLFALWQATVNDTLRFERKGVIFEATLIRGG